MKDLTSTKYFFIEKTHYDTSTSRAGCYWRVVTAFMNRLLSLNDTSMSINGQTKADTFCMHVQLLLAATFCLKVNVKSLNSSHSASSNKHSNDDRSFKKLPICFNASYAFFFFNFLFCYVYHRTFQTFLDSDLII